MLSFKRTVDLQTKITQGPRIRAIEVFEFGKRVRYGCRIEFMDGSRFAHSIWDPFKASYTIHLTTWMVRYEYVGPYSPRNPGDPGDGYGS